MDTVHGKPYICIGGVDAKVKIYDVIDGQLVEVRITALWTPEIGSELKCLICLVLCRPRRGASSSSDSPLEPIH